MRLTKYEPQENSMFPYQLQEDELRNKLTAIHKLGLLEDIEDKLGIELLTLIKALKNGVYDSLGNHWTVRLNKEDGEWYLYTMLVKYSRTQIEEIYKDRLSFSSYGKTWALTKEELL